MAHGRRADIADPRVWQEALEEQRQRWSTQRTNRGGAQALLNENARAVRYEPTTLAVLDPPSPFDGVAARPTNGPDAWYNNAGTSGDITLDGLRQMLRDTEARPGVQFRPGEESRFDAETLRLRREAAELRQRLRDREEQERNEERERWRREMIGTGRGTISGEVIIPITCWSPAVIPVNPGPVPPSTVNVNVRGATPGPDVMRRVVGAVQESVRTGVLRATYGRNGEITHVAASAPKAPPAAAPADINPNRPRPVVFADDDA